MRDPVVRLLAALQFQTEFFCDHLTASQNRDVLEHCFTAITEARSFNRYSREGTTQSVHNESRQRFAFYVFCDDQEVGVPD